MLICFVYFKGLSTLRSAIGAILSVFVTCFYAPSVLRIVRIEAREFQGENALLLLEFTKNVPASALVYCLPAFLQLARVSLRRRSISLVRTFSKDFIVTRQSLDR